jgi:hypothetical protein
MADGFVGIEIEEGGPSLLKYPRGMVGFTIDKADRQTFLFPKGMMGIEVNVTSAPSRGVQKTVKKKLN